VEYSCPESEYQAHLAGIWDKTLTFSAGYPTLPAFRVRGYDKDPDFAGESRIVVTFQSPNWRTFPHGKASLRVEKMTQNIKVSADVETGAYIETDVMSESDGADGYNMVRYVPVVAGSNIVQTGYTVMVVSTSYYVNELNWATVQDRVGTRNSNTMTRLGPVAKGKALLLSAVTPYFNVEDLTSLGERDLVPIEYRFAISKDEWPEEIDVAKQILTIQQQPVTHQTSKPGELVYSKKGTGDTNATATDKDDARKRDVRIWNVVSTSKQKVRSSSNFSDLDGLIEWR